MLENISRYITPDIYKVLYFAGHQDEIVIADANYPSYAMCNIVIRSECPDNSLLLGAILQYLPIDNDRESPFTLFNVEDAHYKESPLMIEIFQKVLMESVGRIPDINYINKKEFYERSKKAYALIQTSDYRPFATVLVTKGMILNEY